MRLGSLFCMYCGDSYEIASHVMRECLRAMSILLNVVDYSSQAGFFREYYGEMD